MYGAAKSPCFLLGILCTSLSANARPLSVHVASMENRPLPYAVLSIDISNTADSPRPNAIMDQIHKNFAPYILPIQTGTWVDFPNSDSINHHVYSFSAAKRFELKLFKGEPGPHSVQFTKPGIVTLGCNLHDWMLAYIVVLDSPRFTQTDAEGRAQLDLPGGDTDISLHLWHPQLDEQDMNVLVKAGTQRQEIRLQHPLKPDLRRPVQSYQ